MKEAASEDSSSAIRQAYLAALQQELSSLYQLMAQLDALAGHPLPAGTALPMPKSCQSMPWFSTLDRSYDQETPRAVLFLPDILGSLFMQAKSSKSQCNAACPALLIGEHPKLQAQPNTAATQ